MSGTRRSLWSRTGIAFLHREIIGKIIRPLRFMARPTAEERGSFMGFSRFADRVAVVTGGGSGMGAAIALRLAEEGATVVIAGRDAEKLSRTAKQAPESGAIVERVVDVRDQAAVIRLVDGTAEEFGRLDVLVNCAGASDVGLFAELDAQTWQDMIAVNASASSTRRRPPSRT
jgi:NADP-dependent 3-hydroxy acid dehydrogenase YdfG